MTTVGVAVIGILWVVLVIGAADLCWTWWTARRDAAARLRRLVEQGTLRRVK